MNYPSQKFLSKIMRRFVLLVVAILPFTLFRSSVQAVPSIVATKEDTLVVDNNGNGFADPGDTIRYTAIITQLGTTNAVGVAFADTIDANTTLVAGSPRTTPIARNDQYASLGNVGITVPAGSGVLTNDNDPDGQAVSVIPAAGSTSAGGAFAIENDGAFSYLPPPGYEGADSFQYTIQDTDGNQDPAFVFISVNEVIWFIDNSLSSSGTGVLNDPFNSIGAFNSSTADDPGDIIFIYSGNSSYINGIILRNNQILIGEGATASIAAITGITVPPFSSALPTTGGARPTITTTSGDGVLLGQNNTLRGFNVGNTAGVGISDNGGSVGTFDVSQVAISGMGGGIEVDNGGTLSVQLDSLSASSSSDEGIDLENVSGSFSVTGPSGTINMTGVPAVVVDGNPSLSLTLSFQSISAGGSGKGISIRDTTGTFSVNGTGTTDGSGGTIQNITNRGFEAINTGSTSFSLSNMIFTSATTANGVAPGTPTCNTTEPAGLTNTGCNAPIYLENVSGVTLTNLTINGSAQNGINGNGVTNFSLINSELSNIGDENLENGIQFFNLLGNNTFDNVTIDGSRTRNTLIENVQGSSTINLTNSTINNAVGEDGFFVKGASRSGNNASITFNATDNSFIHNHSVQLKAHAEEGSTVDVNITGNVFDGEPNVVGNVGIDLAGRDNAVLTFDVTGTGGNPQTFAPFRSHPVNVFILGGASGSGTVSGNTIQGSEFGAGVRAIAEVTTSGNPSLVIDVSNNNISNVKGGGLAGIDIRSRQGVVAASGVANVQATVNNNAIGVTSTADANIQFYINSGNTLCAAVTKNAASGTPFFGDAFYVGNPVLGDSLGAGTAQLSGWTGDINTTWNNNGNTPTNSAFLDGAISGPCTPTLPTAFTTSNTTVAQSDNPLSDSQLPLFLDFNGLTFNGQSLSFHLRNVVAVLFEDARQMVASYIENTRIRTAHASGETINFSLGTLNPGQEVVITFDVTIDNPQIPATNSQVCNQGLISGDNFANVLTIDLALPTFYSPTCTILAPGTIIIAKDQSPNGADSFGFTSDIPGHAAFNVSGDSSVIINYVPAGSYTVTEDDPSAGFFALTGLSCTDSGTASPSTTDLGTRTATINLEPGETVTCTFTNQLQASIEVVKVVDETPNGESFDLLIDGDVEASGVTDSGTTGEVGVALGSHTVSETGTNLGNYNTEIECVEQNSGSELAFSSDTSISTGPLSPGDDVLCTITNTHKRGSLEVVKDLYPVTDSGSFDLIIGSNILATGGDGTTTGEQSVPVGTHLVGETGNLTNLGNYTVSIACKDNNGAGSEVPTIPNGTYGWNVEVSEGDDIVCTITNQRKGTINIVKEAIPADDTVFTFNDNIAGTFFLQDPSDDTETYANISAGDYTINEVSIPTSWELTDITCVEDQAANSTEDVANALAMITLDPGETVTCTFTNLLNQPPVANDDSATTDEDTPVNIDVLANDTDPDGDALTVASITSPSNGSVVLNPDSTLTYTPNVNYCDDLNPDTFTYQANDGLADSNVATVSISVACVDDPPVVSVVGPASQTIQYSDHIAEVTITATDVDSHPLTISDDAPSDLSTTGGCQANSAGTSCTWTLSGQVLVSANTYNITFTVSDETTDVPATTTIQVVPEDAAVNFDSSNDVSAQVDSPGGDSGSFSLTVYIQEKQPDEPYQPTGTAAAGDISLADVSMTLSPVGPGSPAAGACSVDGVTGSGYDAVLAVICTFDGVGVNTYTVEVTVNGGYYRGFGEDVFTVYDPSLGFTTGGGWFYWPGTTEKTNFGYTMKYNKKATNLKGSLLIIRHLADGSIYRLKSNALDGLALGDEGSYGWATFAGKATYRSPSMPEPEGNHTFTVYVEDHGEPGDGDRFWVEIRDKDGKIIAAFSLSVIAADNAVTLEGGNIVVPHGTSSKGKNK